MPETHDTTQYLQVDMTNTYRFKELQTQGRSDYSSWVTTFEIYYSYDGNTFLQYNNTNGTSVSHGVTSILLPNIH